MHAAILQGQDAYMHAAILQGQDAYMHAAILQGQDAYMHAAIRSSKLLVVDNGGSGSSRSNVDRDRAPLLARKHCTPLLETLCKSVVGALRYVYIYIYICIYMYMLGYIT